MARTGRRPGEGGTREAIIDAARAEFAEHGYGGTSIRKIARAAGVDPALIYHYFKDKQAIFVAAMNFPFNPTDLIESVLRLPEDQVGEGIIRLLATLWEAEPTRAPFLALLRSVVSSEQVATMIREFFTDAMVARVIDRLGTPDAALRAALIGSQVAGLVMMRYILRLEPLASLPTEQLVRVVGPNFQRYFSGDLGLPDGQPPRAGGHRSRT